MRNIKLILQYDGSAYHGWQRQNNAVTIQEVCENAVAAVTRSEVKLTGCGRTDAGVHARAYVCNFKSDTKIPEQRLCHAINSALPEDIICIGAQDMPEAFDAKRSAKSKHYMYKIYNAEFFDVFLRGRAWHVKYPLDIEKMQRAAQAFLGEHDFAGFASSGYSVKTTVRTIYSLEVAKSDKLITIDVCGNGFLYNMVRIITGTLVSCGAGRINPDEMSGIIAACDRKRAGITAPAEGLYLSEVCY